MELTIGEHAGFCFGVRRAVLKAFECAEKQLPCVTLGPLIHNPQEVERLRRAGIRTQLHCEQKKFKAKISYADKLGIPYVIFLGEDEISAGIVACKDMKSGEQTKLPVSETITRIKAGLDELEKGSVIVE